MNNFKVGDWVECISAEEYSGRCLTNGMTYRVLRIDDDLVYISNDLGGIVGYYDYRFELYQSTQEKSMTETVDKSDTVLEEQHIKEFLKKLEYVLWNDTTVFQRLIVRAEELVIDADVTTIYGVDDVYTYINNSYDQLTSQVDQKRKQELLDKKSALDLELAQINNELGGL